MNKVNMDNFNIKKNQELANRNLALKKGIVVALSSTLLLSTVVPAISHTPSLGQVLWGLSPKAHYLEYDIYDLVEQRGLACPAMIEYLGYDYNAGYEYYFSCLRSETIYFVGNNEIINVKHAYNAGIITLEQLYELGIVERMPITYKPDDIKLKTFTK